MANDYSRDSGIVTPSICTVNINLAITFYTTANTPAISALLHQQATPGMHTQ